MDNFVRNKGHAKALIAIGGYTLTANFATMASYANNRATFIQNLINFLNKYGFDGVSLDWYMQSWTVSDFDNLVSLLHEMHTAFGGKYQIAVTAAAKPPGFHVSRIDRYVVGQQNNILI